VISVSIISKVGIKLVKGKLEEGEGEICGSNVVKAKQYGRRNMGSTSNENYESTLAKGESKNKQQNNTEGETRINIK
jgi:hypothetical protein